MTLAETRRGWRGGGGFRPVATLERSWGGGGGGGGVGGGGGGG